MIQYQGYLIIIIALVIGSIKPVLMTFGLNNISIPTITMLIMIFILSAAISYFYVRPRPLEKREIKPVLTSGVLLFCYTISTLFALKFSNVITVTSIIAITPLVVGIHQAIIRQKQLNKKFFIGFILAFVGVLTVINLIDIHMLNLNAKGILFSFLTVLFADIYRVTLDKATKKTNLSPDSISSYMLITSAAICLTLIPFYVDSVAQYNNIGVWLVISGIALCSVFANLLFVKAIKIIGATSVSMVCILQPAIVLLIAVLFLGEKSNLSQITGISLIIFGIFVSESKYAEKRQKAKQKLKKVLPKLEHIKSENEKLTQ